MVGFLGNHLTILFFPNVASFHFLLFLGDAVALVVCGHLQSPSTLKSALNVFDVVDFQLLRLSLMFEFPKKLSFSSRNFVVYIFFS